VTVSLPHWMPRRLQGGRIGRHLRLTVRRRINHRSVLIPLAGGMGLDNLSTFEPWLDDVLKRLLERRPGAFVDVGVNVGQTLLKLKTQMPDARYIGFEPNPACYEYTRRLVELNRFTACTLVPAGLYDSPAVVQLYIRGDSDVAGSVIAGFRPDAYYRQTRHVVVLPGDLTLQQIGAPPIAVIKIDVEGAELEALCGLRQTLASRPFVLCEILPLLGKHNPKYPFRKPRQDRLLVFMREQGYDLYRILSRNRVVPLDDIEIHQDVALTNYLFAPSEERRFVEVTFAAASACVEPIRHRADVVANRWDASAFHQPDHRGIMRSHAGRATFARFEASLRA
jgi:FkbM family methyltransferase